MPNSPAHAAGVVRVISPSAVHSSLEAIAGALQARGGIGVDLTFETAPALAGRLADGETFDVIIAPPAVMDVLVSGGKADPDGRCELGRVGVGVAVREGAPLPDVSSTAALVRSLLEADAIVHTRASSGIHVGKLLERLGVAAAISAKVTTFHDAQGAFTRLLSGTGREIGFGGMTEIRRWSAKGLRLVGPLPPETQNYTAYVAAPAVAPANREGAGAFLRFLAGPAAAAMFTANGVERSV